MKIYETDILIIGSGQSGLSLFHLLKKIGKKILIVDQNKKVGDSWAKRYDSLSLLTPWEDDVLPGFTIGSKKNSTYPSKDEYAEYLRQYSKKINALVHLDTKVQELKKEKGFFYSKSNKLLYKSKFVIVATGPFQRPYIPEELIKKIKSASYVHSSEYKNSKSIKGKNILVVGGGYSGLQIAVELCKTRKVTLSMTNKMVFSNRLDFLYRIAFGILRERGIRALVKLLGIRKVRVPDIEKFIADKKILLKPRLIKVKEDKFFFLDQTVDTFDFVVWSTGFQFDYNWIKIPKLFHKNRSIKEKNGVTSIAGLYIVYPKGDYGFIKDLKSKINPIVEDVFEKI